MTHSVIAREKLRSNTRSTKFFTDRNETLDRKLMAYKVCH